MKSSLHLDFSGLASAVKFQSLKKFNQITERKLLGPHYEGQLIPIEIDLPNEQTNLSPLIFVHGRSGSAKHFLSIIPAVQKFSQHRLFYFAYDDIYRSLKRSSLEMAQSLLLLKTPRITLVAHSVGALIVRDSLNILRDNYPHELLPEIHVIAIDAPWHGANDSGPTWFMPPAIADIQYNSIFLKCLYEKPLLDKFAMTLFFAEGGDQTWDYTEGPLKNLPQKISDYFNFGIKLKGSLMELNFWNALQSSSQYSYFEVSLHQLLIAQNKQPLTTAQILQELLIYFPRLPGDHLSVLSPQPGPKMDLARYLDQIL